ATGWLGRGAWRSGRDIPPLAAKRHAASRASVPSPAACRTAARNVGGGLLSYHYVYPPPITRAADEDHVGPPSAIAAAICHPRPRLAPVMKSRIPVNLNRSKMLMVLRGSLANPQVRASN